LKVVLANGLPWDTKGNYNVNNIEVFLEFNVAKNLYPIKNAQSWPHGKGLVQVNID